MISGEHGRAARRSPHHPDPGNAETMIIRLGGQEDGDATIRLARDAAPPGSPNTDTVVLPQVRPAPRSDDTVLLDPVRAAPGSDDTMLLDRVGQATDVRRPARHRQQRSYGALARTVAHTTGELMITFGLVLLLFAAYEVWGKAAIVADHQNALDAQLDEDWSQDPVVVAPTQPPPSPGATAGPNAEPPVPPGDAIGRLYLPRLGNYWVVVEGVDPADIEFAPGHYPETAMPGQVGNFSVAGHRSPAIFWDLDRVQNGDAVVVETRSAWYIYRVTQSLIVSPFAVEVVAPVPGQPGATPSEEFLTLTTCNPKWDNYERLIVHAQLERTQDRSSGRPPELAGM